MEVTTANPTPPPAAVDTSAGKKSDAAGLSLTQDSLRRLRKNPVAMISFWTLVVIAALAVLTPLLPLAPPDRIDTRYNLAAPTLEGFFRDSFRFDSEEVARTRRVAAETQQAIAAAQEKLSEAERSGGGQESSARREHRRLVMARRGVIQKPYRDAGYPSLGPVARAMVRARNAVFGPWELGPVCGRDKLGRDILSRVFWGARVSLIVGLVATLVSLVIGVSYGMISGYAGGWIDNAMMRVVDVLYSLPFIFLVIFIISILNADELKPTLEYYRIDRTVVFYFVVGAIYWLTMARVVRGQVLSLRSELFIEAARSIGVGRASIIFKHILPNLLGIVIVYLTLTIPRVVLFEAFLSFLGLGVEPPDVSWGLLANEGIKVITPVKIYWWLILFPSLAIGVTLFALNFLGDGLRDAFDPRLKDS